MQHSDMSNLYLELLVIILDAGYGGSQVRVMVIVIAYEMHGVYYERKSKML